MRDLSDQARYTTAINVISSATLSATNLRILASIFFNKWTWESSNIYPFPPFAENGIRDIDRLSLAKVMGVAMEIDQYLRALRNEATAITDTARASIERLRSHEDVHFVLQKGWETDITVGGDEETSAFATLESLISIEQSVLIWADRFEKYVYIDSMIRSLVLVVILTPSSFPFPFPFPFQGSRTASWRRTRNFA